MLTTTLHNEFLSALYNNTTPDSYSKDNAWLTIPFLNEKLNHYGQVMKVRRSPGPRSENFEMCLWHKRGAVSHCFSPNTDLHQGHSRQLSSLTPSKNMKLSLLALAITALTVSAKNCEDNYNWCGWDLLKRDTFPLLSFLTHIAH